MSGIVGIVNWDGEPVDRELFQKMTDYMNFRGPDEQHTWLDNNIAFGHTMLRTTEEAFREHQPFTFDQDIWITADARIDGRDELKQKLTAQGRRAVQEATDVELILHAYYAWGENCLQHLLGDFAFAIWDGRKQQLFCARDHFGVKPFFYAQVDQTFIFSNTLNSIRLHPRISDSLNDLAICDFLLYGSNMEPDTTSFADIQRLTPAHYMIGSKDGQRIQRYWSLPLDGHIRYKRQQDYVDHFREILKTAVRDRLRTDKVGSFMSGGLDSTSVTALAHEVLTEQNKPFDLRAFTIVYDKLIPDQERYYSGLVAEHLGIPIHYTVADDYELFGYWKNHDPKIKIPEPQDTSLYQMTLDFYRATAEHSRVVLSGEGGDGVLYSSSVVDIAKGMPISELLIAMLQTMVQYRLPATFGIRYKLKQRLGLVKYLPLDDYPKLINPDLEHKLDIKARWMELNREKPAIHLTHPAAYTRLTNSLWVGVFESYDIGNTNVLFEVRYPIFDLRVIDYVLSIPSLPWCMSKTIVRYAMQNTLPEKVRIRSKVALGSIGEPIAIKMKQQATHWQIFTENTTLSTYISASAFSTMATGKVHSGKIKWHLITNLASLGYWISNGTEDQNKMILET